jgi:hypothetical protein
MGDRHLGMLLHAFYPTLRRQQPPSEQRLSVPCPDIGVDNQVRIPELILDGNEVHPLRRAGRWRNSTVPGRRITRPWRASIQPRPIPVT